MAQENETERIFFAASASEAHEEAQRRYPRWKIAVERVLMFGVNERGEWE